MARTGEQIVTDILNLVRETSLPSIIGGGIYREGLRPRDSKAEDMVITYTTADAEQFQTGVATINIYVPDIAYRTGHGDYILVKDGARCDAIEKAALEAVKVMSAAAKSNYLFKLRDAIHTQRDEEINQSFVVIRLGFKYFIN